MTRIHGGSPWTRRAIADLSADELEAIDAMLPEGMYVTLGAARRPGNWRIHLMRENGTRYPELIGRVEDVHYIPNGVQTAVNRWRWAVADKEARAMLAEAGVAVPHG